MTKLREKMINAMKLRGFAEKTQKLYVTAVAAMAKYYNASPDTLSKERVRAYLLYLTEQRKLGYSAYNVVCSALRFFYGQVLESAEAMSWIPRRRGQSTLPEILSRAEVERLLCAPPNPKHRALLMTIYSAGLRASEVVRLCVSDIDSERMVIRVQHAKGNKDRYTILSPRLLTELRSYWKRERTRPYLFPGRDPRKPMDRSGARQIYQHAKTKAGITKRGGVHSLRHAFATHLLEAGADLPTIRAMLGHSSLRSTMRYLRVSTEHIAAVKSPLDLLDLPGTRPLG